MARFSPVAMVVSAAALAAAGAAAEEAIRRVEGQATSRAPVTLPADAELVVEARGLRDALMGGAVIPAEGRQVPLAFAIDLPAGPAARLTAALRIDGAVRWQSGPVVVPAGAGAIALGEIVLEPHRDLSDRADYDCDGTLVSVGLDGERLVMTVAGESLDLDPVVAASGAKYALADDPTTFFWSKGDKAFVALRGDDLPECRRLSPPVYRASGFEPDWALVAGEGRIAFDRPGRETLVAPLPEAIWRDGAAVWEVADLALAVRMQAAFCRDIATGMPHPETVTVRIGEETLTGCGGDPEELLGGSWQVTEVQGAAVAADGGPTLAFHNGRLTGNGGCNSYRASYRIGGEGLSIGPAIATRMGCEPAVMAGEERFFAALAEVAGFDIAGNGDLLLRDAYGTTVIGARR